MRPELVFLLPLVHLELKIISFCGVKSNFELKLYIKKVLI